MTDRRRPKLNDQTTTKSQPPSLAVTQMMQQFEQLDSRYIPINSSLIRLNQNKNLKLINIKFKDHEFNIKG